jgi:hypothetical protein
MVSKLAARGALAKFLFDTSHKTCFYLGMENNQYTHNLFCRSANDMFAETAFDNLSGAFDIVADCLFGIPKSNPMPSTNKP